MPEPVETLAAIDVGTNSFHLVVARVTGEDRFEVVTSEKEMVRLGHRQRRHEAADPGGHPAGRRHACGG